MRKTIATIVILAAALFAASAQEGLPASVDNSRQKYFPPVFSQLGGSCAQASSIGYMFTYEMNLLLDRSASEAENRFSYLFSWNFLNDGKDDGSFGWDGIRLSYRAGMMSEADFPRQSAAHQFYWASGYDKYLRALHYRALSIVDMPLGIKEQLQKVKEYLYNDGKGHVLIFSSAARGWKFDEYYDGPSETGYHCLMTSLPTDGGHAMSIVGYDDTVECTFDGQTTYGAFIVANSYGSFYHDRGFYYLPYRFFLEPLPKDAILAKSVTGVKVEYYEPRLVFKVNLDYTSRNDLSIVLGAADSPVAVQPTVQLPTSIVNYQGGDHPMQGLYASSELEIALDATAIADKVDQFKQPKFFLSVTRRALGNLGEGKLLGYEVFDYKSGAHYVFDKGAIDLEMDENIFGLPTTPMHMTSASRVEWLTRSGTPISAPIILRTADGKYVKLRITSKGDEISFKYVYAPDGTTHLGN